jgi:hypothetical protein
VTPCSTTQTEVSEELAASIFIYPEVLNEIWIVCNVPLWQCLTGQKKSMKNLYQDNLLMLDICIPNTQWTCYCCVKSFPLSCRHLRVVLTLALFFPLLVSLSRDLNQPPPEPLEFCSLFCMFLMRVSVDDTGLLLVRGRLGLGVGVASLCLTRR